MMHIDHIQLAIPRGAEDLCRAFWCDLLGCRELEKPELLRSRGGAWFANDEIEIHLGVEVAFQPAKKAHPAFLMADIDALAVKLAAVNYHVRWSDDIPGRRRFFTEDPVGNRIEFIGDT